MKTLTLLRHAKSSWDDPVMRDFDRPLNGKGRRAARAVGRHMRGLGLHFDHIVASPAVRVEETLAEVWSGYGETPEILWDRRVYMASPEALLELVQETPDAADRLLLVGHNPGLEELVLTLVPDRDEDDVRDQVELKYPTAALAELSLDVAHWADVTSGGAILARFVRPRDLDPAFGPDVEAH